MWIYSQTSHKITHDPTISYQKQEFSIPALSPLGIEHNNGSLPIGFYDIQISPDNLIELKSLHDTTKFTILREVTLGLDHGTTNKSIYVNENIYKSLLSTSDTLLKSSSGLFESEKFSIYSMNSIFDFEYFDSHYFIVKPNERILDIEDFVDIKSRFYSGDFSHNSLYGFLKEHIQDNDGIALNDQLTYASLRSSLMWDLNTSSSNINNETFLRAVSTELSFCEVLKTPSKDLITHHESLRAKAKIEAKKEQQSENLQGSIKQNTIVEADLAIKTATATSVLHENKNVEKASFPGNKSQIQHIFRDAPGHFNDDTSENRQLIQDVANDPKCFVKEDKHGNEWYAKNIDNGKKQVWVQSRDGVIQNAGINVPPEDIKERLG